MQRQQIGHAKTTVKPMIYLQTSQKARTALGISTEAFAPPGATDSALGNWKVTVVPIGLRRAFVFMSSPSFLSFPVMMGQQTITVEDMPLLLSYGVSRLMEQMQTPPSQRSRLLLDMHKVAICKATDTSMIGLFRSVARDYDDHVDRRSGLALVDMDAIVTKVNTVPRAKLDFQTSYEVSRGLLSVDRHLTKSGHTPN
jgi:hypothetical protein